MFAKNLELLLSELSQKSDVSQCPPQEFAERFEALRGYSKLPRGRENRSQVLASREIAAAILGLVATRPKWAGHAATILCNLRPVGGAAASFFETSTLGESVEQLLIDPVARKGFIKLNVSLAESGTNSHGFATLSHDIGGVRHRVSYVVKEALSLFQTGAERDFDPEMHYSDISRATIFNHSFFKRVALAIERAKRLPAPPAGDGSEYDAEEAQQQRYRKLDVRPNSRFLNIGVDNQVTWPKQETLVKFDRYHFVLMPKTRDDIQSIHVDLTANGLSDDAAMTVINRFLSLMTWCDDQFAIAQDGWSGNPVPVAVPKRNLAFATAHSWIFDRKIPSSGEAKLALALYREARNAQQNFMVSYAVLNFVKVIENRHPGANKLKNWFRGQFDILNKDQVNKSAIDQFYAICGSDKPEVYLWNSCRVAVAHVRADISKTRILRSDPDDATELTRLRKAADVLHILARHFIETELGISDVPYSGD